MAAITFYVPSTYLTAWLMESSVHAQRGPILRKLKSGGKNGKTTLHDRLLARLDLHRLGVDLPDVLLGSIHPLWVLLAALPFPPRVSSTVLRCFSY